MAPGRSQLPPSSSSLPNVYASPKSDFEFLTLLGKGSFGTVHKVRHKRDQKIFACKDVSMAQLNTTEKKQQTFKETQIMKQLQCEYIVQYIDAFIEGDSLYLVLQFCSGGDLKNYLKIADELDFQRIWKISLCIALGLDYLHTRHILHRDMKSENVFFLNKNSDHVLIGDLGLARSLESTAALASTFCGTPRYLAPEGFRGDRYDNRSDVWALGVILYELCSDAHCGPWDKAETLVSLMNVVMDEKELPPDLPPRIHTAPLGFLCYILLQKDPSERPCMQEFFELDSVRKSSEKYNIELNHSLDAFEMEDSQAELAERTCSSCGSCRRNLKKWCKNRLRSIQALKVLPKSLDDLITPFAAESSPVPDVLTLQDKGFCGKHCSFLVRLFRAKESGLGPRFHNSRHCELCEAQAQGRVASLGEDDAEVGKVRSSKFAGLTKTRHHCRNCGRSVCRLHSPGRHKLPHFGYVELQRICDVCCAFPLGIQERGCRLMIVAAGVNACVWNSRSTAEATSMIGNNLAWAGVASWSGDGPDMLCTLDSRSGAAVEVRDLTDGCEVQHSVPLEAGSTAQAVAISGPWLAVLLKARVNSFATVQSGLSIRVLNLPEGDCIGHCTGIDEEITALAVYCNISTEEADAPTRQDSDRSTGSMKSADVSSGSMHSSLKERLREAAATMWTPVMDQGIVLAGTKKGMVMIWNVPMSPDACERLCFLDGHSDMVTCITVGDDAKLVCTGSKDRTVRLWRRPTAGKDVPFQEDVSTNVTLDHAPGKSTVCCHGTYLAYVQTGSGISGAGEIAASKQICSIWNLLTEAWDRDIMIPGYSINHITLRGLILVTSSTSHRAQETAGFFNFDGTLQKERCVVQLWHVETGIQLLEFSNPSSLCWLSLAEIHEERKVAEPVRHKAKSRWSHASNGEFVPSADQDTEVSMSLQVW